MNAADRELFRIALLRVLEANSTRFGLGVPAISLGMGAWGFKGASMDQIAMELRYLFDKGFVATLEKAVSPEIQSWRITANGRDWLAQNG